jgi:hypothetical protein
VVNLRVRVYKWWLNGWRVITNTWLIHLLILWELSYTLLGSTIMSLLIISVNLLAECLVLMKATLVHSCNGGTILSKHITLLVRTILEWWYAIRLILLSILLTLHSILVMHLGVICMTLINTGVKTNSFSWFLCKWYILIRSLLLKLLLLLLLLLLWLLWLLSFLDIQLSQLIALTKDILTLIVIRMMTKFNKITTLLVLGSENLNLIEYPTLLFTW